MMTTRKVQRDYQTRDTTVPGEVNWQRVERNLFAELDRLQEMVVSVPERKPRRRYWLGAAAVVAIATLSLLGVGLANRYADNRVTQIQTGKTGTRVVLGESVLDIAGESSLRVYGNDASRMRVLLDKGAVEIKSKGETARITSGQHWP